MPHTLAPLKPLLLALFCPECGERIAGETGRRKRIAGEIKKRASPAEKEPRMDTDERSSG